MTKRHRQLFSGALLVLVPPVGALVAASLAVAVSRHDIDETVPAPAVWDTLFPILFLGSFFSVPIGLYMVYRAIKGA